MQWIRIGIHAMLNGVFHNRLHGQRRQTEMREWRIIFDNKQVVKQRLFYSQVGAGVFQLCGKGNGTITGDSVEIPWMLARVL